MVLCNCDELDIAPKLEWGICMYVYRYTRTVNTTATLWNHNFSLSWYFWMHFDGNLETIIKIKGRKKLFSCYILYKVWLLHWYLCSGYDNELNSSALACQEFPRSILFWISGFSEEDKSKVLWNQKAKNSVCGCCIYVCLCICVHVWMMYVYMYVCLKYYIQDI